MKKIITVTLVLILCFGTVSAVSADTEPIEIFDGIAELLLKEGWEFLDNRAYYSWSVENTDYQINEDAYQPHRDSDGKLYSDSALIWPVNRLISSENIWPEWSAHISYNNWGHLDEIYEIDKKRYLTGWTADTEFYYDPVYDYDKHKLSWCLRHDISAPEPWLQYWELTFTREGCLEIMLNCSEQDEAEGLIGYIRDAITITNGNTYSDFDPETDSIYTGSYGDSMIYGDGFPTNTPGFLFDPFIGFMTLIVLGVPAAIIVLSVKKSRKKREE